MAGAKTSEHDFSSKHPQSTKHAPFYPTYSHHLRFCCSHSCHNNTDLSSFFFKVIGDIPSFPPRPYRPILCWAWIWVRGTSIHSKIVLKTIHQCWRSSNYETNVCKLKSTLPAVVRPWTASVVDQRAEDLDRCRLVTGEDPDYTGTSQGSPVPRNLDLQRRYETM